MHNSVQILSGRGYSTGTEAAAKKWRGLINIHEPCQHYDSVHTDVCNNIAPPCQQSARTHPYRAGLMLNQLRCGDRVWPMF